MVGNNLKQLVEEMVGSILELVVAEEKAGNNWKAELVVKVEDKANVSTVEIVVDKRATDSVERVYSEENFVEMDFEEKLVDMKVIIAGMVH